MATFINNEDELVPCPYNSIHKVKHSRLQTHIIKCRKRYPDRIKQVCPFNARHCIAQSDYKEHLISCPDKDAVDKRVIENSKEDKGFKGRTAVPSYSGFKTPGTEYWDATHNEPTEDQLLFAQMLSQRMEEQLSVNEEEDDYDSDSDDENSSSTENDGLKTNLESTEFKVQGLDNVKTRNFITYGRGQLFSNVLNSTTNTTDEIPLGRGRGFRYKVSSNERLFPKNPHSSANKTKKIHCILPVRGRGFGNRFLSNGEFSSNFHSPTNTPDCVQLGRGRGFGRGLISNELISRNPNSSTNITDCVLQGKGRGFGNKLLSNDYNRNVHKTENFTPEIITVKRVNRKFTSPKLKDIISNLPPCEPGQISDIPKETEDRIFEVLKED